MKRYKTPRQFRIMGRFAGSKRYVTLAIVLTERTARRVLILIEYQLERVIPRDLCYRVEKRNPKTRAYRAPKAQP